MFPATWFIALFFSLTSSVAGNIVRANRSPITLPIARRVNLTSIRNLPQHEQTRATLLKAQGAAKASGLIHNDAVINSPADNQAVDYVASVGIGSPATTCKCWTLRWMFFFSWCSKNNRFAHRWYLKVCISVSNSSKAQNFRKPFYFDRYSQ